jgi:hypothetical protein
MKLLPLVVIVLVACSKKESAPAAGSAATGSGSAAAGSGSAAAPAEDVSCDDASKAYAKKMAASPGNVLSNAKPDDGLVYFTGISMSDYCEGEGGLVPWTAAERACVKNAAGDPSSCFSGASLTQVNMGLDEVVTSALKNRKDNEAREAADKGAGSGSAAAGSAN